MWPCLAVGLCLLTPTPVFIVMSLWAADTKIHGPALQQTFFMQKWETKKVKLVELMHLWIAFKVSGGMLFAYQKQRCLHCRVNKSTGSCLKTHFNQKFYSSLLASRRNCTSKMEEIKHVFGFVHQDFSLSGYWRFQNMKAALHKTGVLNDNSKEKPQENKTHKRKPKTVKRKTLTLCL